MSTKFGISWQGIMQQNSDDKPMHFDSHDKALKYLESINEHDNEDYAIFPFPGASGTIEPQAQEPSVTFINNRGDISYAAGPNAQAVFTLANGSKLTVKVDPHEPNSISVTTGAGPIVIKPDVSNQVHIEVGKR